MNFLKLFLIGLFGNFIFQPLLKAGYDSWAYKNVGGSTGIEFYKVNSLTGSSSLIYTDCEFLSYYGNCGYSVDDYEFDASNNVFKYKRFKNNSGQKVYQPGDSASYAWYGLNLDTGAITDLTTPWSDSYTQTGAIPRIFKSSDGTVSIKVGEDKILEKKPNGEFHLGENSLVTKEENGQQQLWGQDANGDKIPININGSKLLIDGVEILPFGSLPQITTNKNNITTNKNNINNLGSGVAGITALTAALTSLPQTSKESKLSCGVGTGAYSSRYAVGFGCASKVNDRVDINAGGSYVFGGSKSYGGGTLDSGVVKAGFVFKLGELNKPSQISLNESNELKKEVKDLKDKNDQIISQNQKLLSRLEKLENIALKFQSSSEMISVATKE